MKRIFLCALLCMSSPALAQPVTFPHLSSCMDASSVIGTPCVLPTPFDAKSAAARLGQSDHVWWVDGDKLNVVARPAQGFQVALCCSVQTPLAPIRGSGLASVTVRIPRMREAILEIRLFPGPRFFSPSEIWRGPDAPPAPPRADPMAGHVTVYDFPSKILGENRRLTIYVPPGVPKGKKLPVIYLADDMAAAFAPITETEIAHGKVRPIILVGIGAAMPTEPNCTNPKCDRRALEYLLDANGGDATGANPFSRHMRFVTEEVVPYIEANFPALNDRESRAVGGSSNGGDWAIAAAALHPKLFGNVMALSGAAHASIQQAAQLGKAKLFGGSGLLEPDLLTTTEAALDKAKAAGNQTQASILVSGHSPLAWDVMFVQAEAWLFPVDKGAMRPGK
jgi:enterochelin esterase-like enzyme